MQTFADAKGYLVTEMVVVEVSDNEDDAAAVSSSVLSKGHQPAYPTGSSSEQQIQADVENKGHSKAIAKPKQLPKKGAASAANQKSMTSFFGKK